MAAAFTVDLIDRGYTLQDIGGRLSWFDVRSLLEHLPPTAAVKRVLSPEAYKRALVLTPENQLLARVHDALWDVAYASSGSEYRTPRLLDEFLGAVLDPGPPEDPGGSPEATETPPVAKPKPLTSSQIRAKIAARVRT